MHANYARFNGYSGATGCDENPDSVMFVSVSGEERLDTRRAKACVPVSCSDMSSSPISLSVSSPLQPLHC